jgi:protein-tyrosine phosphatase
MSDSYTAQSKFMLSHFHITHVISFERADIRFPDIPDYNVIRLNIKDEANQNLFQYFKVINDEILKVVSSGGNILVSSTRGCGRCCAIIIAFLIQHCSFTFSSGLEHVKSKQAATNIVNFTDQLRRFEYELEHMDTD